MVFGACKPTLYGSGIQNPDLRRPTAQRVLKSAYTAQVEVFFCASPLLWAQVLRLDP